jgi:hypothetical protein
MRAAVKRRPRVGRPIKAPAGKKAQIMLLVRADVKRELSKRAHNAGHTLSREGELWIEELLDYWEQYERTKLTVKDIDRGAIAAALHRRGYTRLRDWQGNEIWFSPGHPQAPRPSGFEPLTQSDGDFADIDRPSTEGTKK